MIGIIAPQYHDLLQNQDLEMLQKQALKKQERQASKMLGSDVSKVSEVNKVSEVSEVSDLLQHLGLGNVRADGCILALYGLILGFFGGDFS